MNSTNGTINPSLDYWLSLYGFPFIVDIIVAYFITPIWLLTLILSIFSLFILLKPPFLASYFFSYMRLYAVNCLVLSLIALTTILVFTRRYLSISNTQIAAFYGIYVFFTAQNSLFLFSSTIEICIVVEKVLFMLPRSFRRMKISNLNRFFFILFILCVLVNLPGIFIFETAYVDVQLDPDTKFRIWYYIPTSFSYTLTGQILNYFGYLFRDIIPMILKLIFNSLSICLVGKYFIKKHRTVSATASSYLVSIDRKQTYIALSMNTFSLLEHSLYIASYISYFFYGYPYSAERIACGRT